MPDEPTTLTLDICDDSSCFMCKACAILTTARACEAAVPAGDNATEHFCAEMHSILLAFYIQVYAQKLDLRTTAEMLKAASGEALAAVVAGKVRRVDLEGPPPAPTKGLH